jgi:transcription elongation GreA/GreB family factor
MSVAFRRDSDEEHLEPKFELPIPHGPNLVTARGMALIEARLAEVEALLVPALSEEERKRVLRDARYWRHQAASAQVVPVPDGETVAIGTVVTIEQAGGKPRTIEIVGHDEADPQAGRLVFSAPLARALIGAEMDEEVEFPGPGKTIRVTAIEVRGD